MDAKALLAQQVAHFWGQIDNEADKVAVNLVAGLVAELRRAA
jgi:hypothetical protein